MVERFGNSAIYWLGCRFDSRPCKMTLCPWARHFRLLASGGMSLYLLYCRCGASAK